MVVNIAQCGIGYTVVCKFSHIYELQLLGTLEYKGFLIVVVFFSMDR